MQAPIRLRPGMRVDIECSAAEGPRDRPGGVSRNGGGGDCGHEDSRFERSCLDGGPNKDTRVAVSIRYFAAKNGWIGTGKLPVV